MTDETWKHDLAEYRKKKFKAEIKPSDHPMIEGEMSISVTHNGYQWMSISLSPDELKKVYKIIKNHLEKK
jgi:hypothetical protein